MKQVLKAADWTELARLMNGYGPSPMFRGYGKFYGKYRPVGVIPALGEVWVWHQNRWKTPSRVIRQRVLNELGVNK